MSDNAPRPTSRSLAARLPPLNGSPVRLPLPNRKIGSANRNDRTVERAVAGLQHRTEIDAAQRDGAFWPPRLEYTSVSGRPRQRFGSDGIAKGRKRQARLAPRRAFFR